MDWADWEPFYEEILADLGFSRRADEQAARELDHLLHGHRLARDKDLRRLLEGKHAVVAGAALSGPLPRGDVLLSCDSAITAVVAQGAHPDVLVTDLDGNVEEQVRANFCCSLAVIHAHGDNLPQLRRWLPQFQGLLMGTCQCEPVGSLRNPGGFTDGDRACFLAAHYGARRITLAGFDFEHPRAKPGKDPAVKKRKLAWAQRLLRELPVEVELAA